MEETEPAAGDNVSQQSTKQQEWPHNIKFTTPYYTGSPAQARSPDGDLRTGTRVRIVEDIGSYVFVETADGVRGYVESGAVE